VGLKRPGDTVSTLQSLEVAGCVCSAKRSVNRLAKTLNVWRRYSGYSGAGQLDSTNASALSTLRAYPHDSSWQAGCTNTVLWRQEVCANRVVETAMSIPKERDTLKTITLVALLLVGLCVVGSPMAVAQDTSSQSSAADSTADAITDQQLALLRRDIRSVKKQLIAANLTLTDSEATKFWQVYEQYSADMGKINDTKTAIIKEYSEEYGTLSDDQADNLIRRWLDTDIEQTKLRQRYVPIFRKVLPGKKAATFFQIERRMSTMIDVQLTSQLPLAQSQD
jgi:hypothetical protein